LKRRAGRRLAGRRQADGRTTRAGPMQAGGRRLAGPARAPALRMGRWRARRFSRAWRHGRRLRAHQAEPLHRRPRA